MLNKLKYIVKHIYEGGLNMKKLFGTDGVRGEANVDLTPELAFQLGLAGAYVLTKETKNAPKIIVGVDTRVSCDMIEAAIVAGMCSVGANVYLAGVVPTPAIPYLIRKNNFDAGVVISASHNLFQDNGIKFFNGKGYKLADKIEEEIEEVIAIGLEKIERAKGNKIGKKHIFTEAGNDYISFLKTTLNGVNLDGIKIALDCSNGATSTLAPQLFKSLGAEVFVSHSKPNGYNINKECGSTHMKSLQKFTIDNKAHIGVAFDGDGDRCLVIDEKGSLVEGDQIMSILAVNLKEKGKLKNNTLVATVMSNLGLFIMGEKLNLNIEKTSVGDRYVLERMIEGDFNLGGEQSGHIILLDYNTTGDGMLTALQLIAIMQEKQKTLSEVNTLFEVLPQVMVNAKVNNAKKYNYLDDDIIKNEIEILEERFKGRGRVLIRPSGTEALVRVMIEGTEKSELTKEATNLAKIIQERLA
jgi:phosphoglucosamine mutase